jgi:hypothetical protein
MASRPPHPMECTSDRCPGDDDSFQTFVWIVSGLGTGAVLVGLIEAARMLTPYVQAMI